MSKVKRLVVLCLFVAGLAAGMAMNLKADQCRDYYMRTWLAWCLKKYNNNPECGILAVRAVAEYCPDGSNN